jgi:hypothetical protein
MTAKLIAGINAHSKNREIEIITIIEIVPTRFGTGRKMWCTTNDVNIRIRISTKTTRTTITVTSGISRSSVRTTFSNDEDRTIRTITVTTIMKKKCPSGWVVRLCCTNESGSMILFHYFLQWCDCCVRRGSGFKTRLHRIARIRWARIEIVQKRWK